VGRIIKGRRDRVGIGLEKEEEEFQNSFTFVPMLFFWVGTPRGHVG
jgi:hypothetical protein